MARCSLLALFLLAVYSIQRTLADEGLDHNPILDLQPAFARSLPVQILLNGIVFALTAVLLIHLLFIAQYHCALALLNYALQLAGVLSLLISLIATLFVVLNSSFQDTQAWPYMINYLAKDVPPITTNSNSTSETDPTTWSIAELAAWYAMDATTSALVQVRSLLLRFIRTYNQDPVDYTHPISHSPIPVSTRATPHPLPTGSARTGIRFYGASSDSSVADRH